MTKSLERSSNNISISNFHEEYQINKYEMNPPYQRLSVWSIEKKAFFIDSILKNLPIPPIFLRQKVNAESGKTSYEVIDGKQRLESIVQFINGDFSTSDEGEDPFHDEDLAGKYFSEISGEKLDEYKKRFWRYQIPVEYVDTEDPIIIDKIFDRLNRNGEPLTGQELRHSNYYSSDLLKLCYKLANGNFWSERLQHTDKARMEDVEFISELLFVILEGKELHATDTVLDQYYDKYVNRNLVNWDEIEMKFSTITNFILNLEIDFAGYKISGVSHLYGIWCFSFHCIKNNVDPNATKNKIMQFYNLLRDRDYLNENVKSYKESMSSSTKYESQRRKRKEAMLKYCNLL